MKTKKKKKSILSDYQKTIRRHVIFIDTKKKQNFSIDAGPGSGKSYTLGVCIRAICKYHEDASIIALQFNRHIKEALEKKFSKYENVTIKTVSSAGLMVCAYNKIRPSGQVNKNKYWGLAQAHVEMHSAKVLAAMKFEEDKYLDDEVNKQKKKTILLKATMQLKAVVEMAMNTLTDFTSIDQLTEMCDKFCVNCTCDFLLTLVEPIIEVGLEATKSGKFGFEDMIFYPVHKNLRFPQFDWVLADEGQDFNACQLEVVTRFAKGKKGNWTGHVGAFADTNQAIMGWAGAMSDSVEQFRKKVNARVMPLSICYRCPSSHLDLARLLVPTVENRPNCPEGEVIPFKQDLIPGVIVPGDYILCRTTAPLVKQCIQLIKHRIPAQVKGREVASKLLAAFDECIQLTDVKPVHIDQFIGVFKEYAEEEMSRAMVKKVSASRMEMIEDTHACIMAIASYLSDESKMEKRFIAPEVVKFEINRLFAEDVAANKVTLSTVHKAKGLEADNVFIIEFDKMPAIRKGETPTADQVQQEKNVKYVALTRGKQKLYICGAGMDSIDAIRQQVLK